MLLILSTAKLNASWGGELQSLLSMCPNIFQRDFATLSVCGETPQRAYKSWLVMTGRGGVKGVGGVKDTSQVIPLAHIELGCFQPGVGAHQMTGKAHKGSSPDAVQC